MPKNAIDLLMTDHRKVEELFSKVQAGSGGKDAVEKIVRELSRHDAIERELLYPLVREKVPTEGERLAEPADRARVEREGARRRGGGPDLPKAPDGDHGVRAGRAR